MRKACLSTIGIAVCLATGAAAAGCASRDEAQRPRRSNGATSTMAAPTTDSSRPLSDLRTARFRLTPVANIEDPTAAANRAGDSAMYVTQQSGQVWAIRDNALDPTPVLDIGGDVSSGGERGLLGLDFSNDGSKLFLNYTNRDGHTRVVEYEMRKDGTADAKTRREILGIAQPQGNHNGGGVVVAPDGMLWIGMGDGGAADDRGPGHAPEGNGQSPETLLGKMLRIDPRATATSPYSIPPDNPYTNGTALPEIRAFGMRNPWKYSFDRETGDLFIANVGQESWEQINRLPKSLTGPINFGWPIREGAHAFRGDDPGTTVAPILEYSHNDGRCSISGGYVYRGTKIENLYGAYIYSDFCDGKIRGTLISADGTAGAEVDFGLEAGNVTGFGEDNAGELYVLSLNQGVLRIDPA
ncbi:MAG: sugar dehydrogenase [Acidimicrobiia bacterium]|nr:sugar dehydrogenase [Acidimicrobiia bacterium]